MTEFFQAAPKLGNQYQADELLRSYLRRKIPAQILSQIEPDLDRMGERAVGDLLELSDAAERNRPKHIPYDPWGNRIDSIETSDAWKKLDRVSAEEKIVAIGYERRQGIYSRIYQFAKLYLFHPASALYTCPLAMTDGAARAIELYGNTALKKSAFLHLTSSDPDFFWTSGQWMTERSGGSDVSQTETVATVEGDHFRLSGTKWFTSATTSQMALTLARIQGAEPGSKGLSLFYVELRDASGKLNSIQVNRLKDKLGTWALPTAELELKGTPAILIGDPGGGVKKISSLFNITRIYNSVCAISNMRRALALAKDYASKRVAFGKPLMEHGLHVDTLARLQIDLEACFHLSLRSTELLGKDELGKATEEEAALLRVLTPLAKLFTAKRAIALTSEVLESFGGAGYVEDTGLPRFLRDSQVLAIWEGTTNVLSLDVLRAIEKENAAPPLFAEMRKLIQSAAQIEPLKHSVALTLRAISQLEAYVGSSPSLSEEDRRTGARALSLSLAKTYAACLMISHAEWSLDQEKNSVPCISASRWCEGLLLELFHSSQKLRDESRALLAYS